MSSNKFIKDVKETVQYNVFQNLLDLTKDKEDSLKTLSTAWNDDKEISFNELLEFTIGIGGHLPSLAIVCRAIMNYNDFCDYFQHRHKKNVKILERRLITKIKNSLTYAFPYTMAEYNQLAKFAFKDAFKKYNTITTNISDGKKGNPKRSKRKKKKYDDDDEDD